MIDIGNIDFLEAKELLLDKGSVFITIKEKHKTRFMSCRSRIDKLEKLLRSNNTLKRVWFYVYSVYASIINTALTSNHEDLNQAVDFYMVSRKYLEGIHGESVEDGMFKMTFKRR